MILRLTKVRILIFYRLSVRLFKWSYLVSETQRAHMNFGCSQQKMVAWAIYNEGGWILTKRIQHA
jgi:hypothetical protein